MPSFACLRGIAVCLLLAGGPARADTWTADFSGSGSDDLTVTILNDGSDLEAGPDQGHFEITGHVVGGTEPAVIVEPPVAVRAGDSWSAEARVLLRHDLLSVLTTRDSLQLWLSVESALDSDDDARSKSGLLKGVFDVGDLTVYDGYFASSGYRLDGDSVPESPDVTEYSTIDPAVADGSASVATTLRIAYDAAQGELVTSYRLDDGPFVVYPLRDESGTPAPVLDPLVDWMLASDDEIDVSLMFSATRAATLGGESSSIVADFTLLPGDVAIEEYSVTGTLLPVPEPSGPLTVAVGVALLAALRRAHTGRR